MTVEKRIEELVIRWLSKHRGILASSARIDEDDWEQQTGYGGCDTCGPAESYMELTIWFTGVSEINDYVEVQTDPLTFLAELLKLEDEAK